MMDSGEEMELDLNSLTNEQFMELLAIVKSCSENRDQGFTSQPVKTETHAAEGFHSYCPEPPKFITQE